LIFMMPLPLICETSSRTDTSCIFPSLLLATSKSATAPSLRPSMIPPQPSAFAVPLGAQLVVTRQERSRLCRDVGRRIGVIRLAMLARREGHGGEGFHGGFPALADEFHF